MDGETGENINHVIETFLKIHLTWSDKTIIYGEESFFKRNKGWLKNWNEDWYNSLSREEQGIYDGIDHEQIKKFGALSWIEYLVQIREEYSAYYGC